MPLHVYKGLASGRSGVGPFNPGVSLTLEEVKADLAALDSELTANEAALAENALALAEVGTDLADARADLSDTTGILAATNTELDALGVKVVGVEVNVSAAQEAARLAQEDVNLALASPPNLLKNSSFEQDLPADTVKALVSLTHNAAAKYGSRSLNVTRTSDGDAYANMGSLSGLSGKRVVISWYARPSNSGKTFTAPSVGIATDDNSDFRSDGVRTYPAGSVFLRYSYAVTLPVSAAWNSAHLVLRAAPSVANEGLLYEGLKVEVAESALQVKPTAWGLNPQEALDLANLARSEAATALSQATNAMTAANGKSKVFHQTAAPGGTLNEGDLWFDTDADNLPHRWSGTAWVAQPLGNAAIGNLDAGKVTTGFLAAGRIAAGTIISDMIAANQITSGKIAALQIVAGHIVADTITGDKIKANSINTGHLTANSVNADKIAAGSIYAGHIVGGQITGDKIAGNTITGANILGGTITGTHIQGGSINGDKITAGTLHADRIIAGTITSEKIAANSINGDRIIGGTITADKISGNVIDGKTINSVTMNSSTINGTNINGGHIAMVGGGARVTVTPNAYNGYSGIAFTNDAGSFRGAIFSDQVNYIKIAGTLYLNNGLEVVGQPVFHALPYVNNRGYVSTEGHTHSQQAPVIANGNLNGNPIYGGVQTNDPNHVLRFNSQYDGMTITGFHGAGVVCYGYSSNPAAYANSQGEWRVGTRVYAASVQLSSSAANKEDIREVTDAGLATLRQLRPVRYTRTADTQGRPFPTEAYRPPMGPLTVEQTEIEDGRIKMTGLRREEMSFIAEEVAEVFPDAAAYDSESEDPDAVWGLDVMALISLLVKSVQDLSAEVDALKPGRPATA